MGSAKLPTRLDGFVMDDDWLNAMKAAICGDVVPRASGGTPTDEGGSLGPTSYQFLKAFIAQGYWDVGDFKLHHSYNGTVSAGEGWMLCDGRTISQANYDTEHGASHWATYVGSSPLNGLKLPNFTGRYPIGAATTPQDGSGTITPTGNTSHQVNLQHRHRWLKVNAGSGLNDQTFDTNGVAQDLSDTPAGAGLESVVSAAGLAADAYTSRDRLDAQSATQSIQPDSIEFQVYMRII